ncbi:MAG: family 43 glycosylhydrolase, partial [bacterium]
MEKLLLAAALLSSSIVSAGCDDTPVGSSGSPCCDPNGNPVFLQSKLDDDDGDGNPYDEDFPAINDEDDDIADHTWIRDAAGVYHLFFHTEGIHGGSKIEHYTSTDFRSLDYVGLALQKNPGGWDSHGLWAPHIVEHDGTYYMFYTGIDGEGLDPNTRQRIGLATSTDLVTWT